MRAPTVKQKRAVKDTLENLGRAKPKSKKQILLDAGYSPAIAKNPDIITESVGFKALLEKYLPDEKLAQVHAQGLEATKIISANITYGEEDEKIDDFIEVPDYTTREKYLKLGYQVKGKLAAEPPPPPAGNTYNLFFMPQVQARIRAAEQDIKSLIASADAPVVHEQTESAADVASA